MIFLKSAAPIGRAIRGKQHIICRDVEHDPLAGLWRNSALAMGYRATASFPLWLGGEVIGALTVYAPQVGWYTDSEVALLDEMAEDVSFGLDALQHEQQRRQAELELRQAYGERGIAARLIHWDSRRRAGLEWPDTTIFRKAARQLRKAR